MKLESFQIKNYKNLEAVTLNNVTSFHTIIGRNSSGKTSIFEALKLIELQGQNLNNSTELICGGITAYEEKRIEMNLRIGLSYEERLEYIKNYFPINEESIEQLLSSNFLKWVNLLLIIRVTGDKHPNRKFHSVVIIPNIQIPDPKGIPIPIVEHLNEDTLSILNFAGGATTKINGSPDVVIRELRRRFNEFTTNSHREARFVPQSFHGRLLIDFIQSLKVVPATRESQKRLKIATINELGEDRGSQLVNLMDTMFTNQNRRYREVEEYCKRIFADIEEIHPEKMSGELVRILIRKKNFPMEIDLTYEGQGIEQLLIIIWKIATSQKNTIWLLDEPELHLHPGAQKLLYDFLIEETGRGKQIIVSSHSMVFIHKSKPEEVSLLINNEGKTRLVQLSSLIDAEKSDRVSISDARNHVYQSLGYDSTFAYEPKTVVLVEGTTDETVLKNFAKTLGMEIQYNATMFIPAGDKKNAERFSPILAYALSGKRTILIVDNDNEAPEEIKKKVLHREETYRKSIGMDQPLLTDQNFFYYRPEAYSIEYYLLDAESICRSAGIMDELKIQEIGKKINSEKQKPKANQAKPKELLRGIWEDNGFGQYDDIETADLISKNTSKEYLAQFYEITNVITAITET